MLFIGNAAAIELDYDRRERSVRNVPGLNRSVSYRGDRRPTSLCAALHFLRNDRLRDESAAEYGIDPRTGFGCVSAGRLPVSRC